MANKKAQRLIELGLHPVLLGSDGEDLKRPCEPFEWRGFVDPHGRRRRWERDGYLRDTVSLLIVSLPGDEVAGVVGWRPIAASGWSREPPAISWDQSLIDPRSTPTRPPRIASGRRMIQHSSGDTGP